ncbi:XkdF-like putative serine protease domain-containing protein [Streptomyces sp. NPDC006477]|uniref:XkdF-like putative serine protease domain-containing protein n=1 Tax=Streptomyces sp. NPDC006477 TaxID=3364747 RepID=UPI0036A1D17F
MTIGHAIATAVNAVKKMCSTGDLNFPGSQKVNSGSKAEACAAVADWERKKASARVSKGVRGRKLTDMEYIEFLVGEEAVSKLAISDAEFEALAAELSDPDDPDTEEMVSFSVEGDISKTDEDKRLVFGWCSVGIMPDGSVVDDKQGDVLDDVEEIEKAAYEFVLNSRDGGEMHVRKGVSTMVESFVSTPEKCAAMGIPEGTLPVGWWVGFRVEDEEVWKAVRDGKYKMFSVHGKGTRKALDS